MKRFLCILLSCLMITPAFADQFADDFDSLADAFGIGKLSVLNETEGETNYMSGLTLISNSAELVVIMGSDALNVISVACCVLRCVDNGGDINDQFGAVLLAYFLNKSGQEGTYATTKTGKPIFFSFENDLCTVGVQK